MIKQQEKQVKGSFTQLSSRRNKFITATYHQQRNSDLRSWSVIFTRPTLSDVSVTGVNHLVLRH